jgi:hypothetical protein
MARFISSGILLLQVVKAEEEKAQKAAAEAKEIKDDCERELAIAMPILKDALAALDTIKEADIAYVRKLGNPPAAIKFVLEAVCVVLGIKPAKAKDEAGRAIDDYWKPSVALLNDKDFLTKLKNYEKDNIPAKVLVVSKAHSTFTMQCLWNTSLAIPRVSKDDHVSFHVSFAILLHRANQLSVSRRVMLHAKAFSVDE